MAIAYQPGDEITLDVSISPIKFTASAMSWGEQRKFNAERDRIAALESEDEQTEQAIKLIVSRSVKANGTLVTEDSLANKLGDWRVIWAIIAALKFNLTAEEKKS